jgi:hypothetical protein
MSKTVWKSDDLAGFRHLNVQEGKLKGRLCVVIAF